jgi:fibronectin type III domain protein
LQYAARAMIAGSDVQPGRRMKMWSRIVLLVVVTGLVRFAGQSFAGPACLLTLEWQPSPDAGVAGYALYYGAAGTPLTNRVDAGTQTIAVVKGLTASIQYTFYVVAYDADLNEGGPSVPLYYTAPPISSLKLSQLADGTMKISFHVAPGAACRVEYTDTLMPPNWNLLTTAAGDSNGLVTIEDSMLRPSRFYRGVAE